MTNKLWNSKAAKQTEKASRRWKIATRAYRLKILRQHKPPIPPDHFQHLASLNYSRMTTAIWVLNTGAKPCP